MPCTRPCTVPRAECPLSIVHGRTSFLALCSGGLELLFGSVKTHELDLPDNGDAASDHQAGAEVLVVSGSQ